MNNNKVKIGIMGCANVAGKHAIKAFQSIDNAEVISIASRDYSKAKEWASRFGIKAERSYDSLIRSPHIDAVYIPLPIGLHKKWVCMAADAGKHVMCEKSLAENFKSAKEMVDGCRLKNIVLYENFVCDFHPQHEKVLSLIKDGIIGNPLVFSSYYGFLFKDKDTNNFRYNKKLGGGILNDAGAYPVFMARKMFGKEPLSVTCDLFLDEEKGVDIKGSAYLEFPDEMVAFLAFNFDAAYQNNYSIWGSEGLIKAKRAYAIQPAMKPVLELITSKDLKEFTTNIDAPAANQFELIFRDFCDTILNKKKRINKINNIYSQLISQAKILEAMRLSSSENRKVGLEELR